MGRIVWRIFGLKGLPKFCVFYLYIIIIYDLHDYHNEIQ